MKKFYHSLKKSTLFLFLLLGFFLQAQQEVNESYSNEVTQTFAGLNKNRVPHGLLLDFAMDFTDAEAFNGQLSDSTNLDRMTYTNLYHTMLMSRVRDVSAGFMLPHEFANTWEGYRRDNNDFDLNSPGDIENAVPTIVLSALYYKYSKIRNNALSQGDIAVQNNQYRDAFVNGQWQNPYENKQVFAVAAPIQEIEGSVVDFLLPTEIVMSNNLQAVNKIEVNADDGAGFRQLNLDQKTRVTYTSLTKEGIRDIVFKITLNNGQRLKSRTRIKFGDPQKQGLQNPPPIGKQAEIINSDKFYVIESEENFNGKTATGIVSINYAAGNTKIKKPLIVAEGYDPGIIAAPENIFGLSDIDDFILEIDGSGGNNLRDLLTIGSSQEYDIIYVDWLNGVDDMRRNAKLLKTVIKWVNDEKADNGSNEENVVLGQSMGGVIARYALREMEIENTDHETRLYVSHDAPHQGANVPYGLQYMARHARNEYVKAPILLNGVEALLPTLINGAAWFSQLQLEDFVTGFENPPNISFPSPYAVLSLADMPASRQLLINFVKSDYNLDNTVHNNWQDELENVGYPQEYGIRNVAISNSSECGQTQDLDPGDYLFRFNGKSSPAFFNSLLRIVTDPLAGLLLNNAELFFTGILPGSSKYNYDIWAKTVPTSSNQQVYKGRIVYTKKLLFLFPIDVVVMNKNLNAPAGSLPIDTYPGGYYNVKSQIDLDSLPSFIGDRITHIENFNFIPVTSSLDIGEGNLNLDEQDYLRAYSGVTPPSSPRQTPFDNFITAFNTNLNLNANQQHISFEVRNANWLADELKNNFPIAGCTYLCNVSEIVGSPVICSGTRTYSFPASNISWSISNSTLASIVPNGNTVAVTRKANGTVKLRADIPKSDCGPAMTIFKTIALGSSVKMRLLSNVRSTEAKLHITGHGITTTPTYTVLSGSGYATLSMRNNYNGSYTLWGRGSTNNWDKWVRITVKSSCGTSTSDNRITPPAASGGCTYVLSSTAQNIYALRPPIDDPCGSSLGTATLAGISNGTISANTARDTFSIKAFNMSGALVLETDTQSIDLKDLKKGIYIIKAIWNGNEITKKIAKK